MKASAVFLAVIVLAGLGAGPAAGFAPRKDAKDLSATEKAAYVGAVLKLKKAKAPGRKDGMSIYDAFVEVHERVFASDGAHSGPAFLPWHRAYLHAFEAALQRVSRDDSIAIPYWDWANPASTFAVFAPDLMGGNGDPKKHRAVVTGPFRKGRWLLRLTVNVGESGPGGGPQRPEDIVTSPFLPPPSKTFPTVGAGSRGGDPVTYLQRDLGGAAEIGVRGLPTAADMAEVLGITSYDSRPWTERSNSATSFRCALEGWGRPKARDQVGGHNAVHVWVGGAYRVHGQLQTGTISSEASPNDPVFWSIHANVDRLWTGWEATQGFVYADGTGIRRHHRLHDKFSLLAKLGRDIGDPELAAGTLTPADLLDPAPWEAPYQAPLAAST